MPDFYGSTATPFYPGGGVGGKKPKTMLDVFNQQNNPSWGMGSPVYGGSVVGTAGQGGMVNYPGYGVMDPTGKFFSPTTGDGKTVWNPTPIPKELFGPPGTTQPTQPIQETTGSPISAPPWRSPTNWTGGRESFPSGPPTPGPGQLSYDDWYNQIGKNMVYSVSFGSPAASYLDYLGQSGGVQFPPTTTESGNQPWVNQRMQELGYGPGFLINHSMEEAQKIIQQNPVGIEMSPPEDVYNANPGRDWSYTMPTTTMPQPTTPLQTSPIFGPVGAQNPYSGYNQYQAPFQEWLSQMFNLSNPFMSQSSGIFG